MSNKMRLAAIFDFLSTCVPPAAYAQPSGRQTTPDGMQVLVNRAEGGMQWAISYAPNDGTITGNVFDPGGGAPSYIWCQRVGDDGVMDPAAVKIDWACEGASACAQAPCLASDWNPLGTVPLGGFFFLPATDPFVTLQQPGTYCDPSGVGFANEFAGTPSWETDTNVCRYATMVQPSLTPIEAGEDLFVRVWNFDLEDPDGGKGFFTLMVGDEVVYSEEMPIPKESGLLGPFGVGPDGVGVCVRPEKQWPAGSLVSYNLQLRPPPAERTTGARRGTAAVARLERPFHSTPGIMHMLEITVGSNCEGEPAGRHLTTNDRWTHVSTGLPARP